MPRQDAQDVYAKHYGQLVGKTIKRVVRDGNPDGIGEMYGLECTDGTVAWIQQDAEGNGPGFLSIEVKS